MKFSGFHGHEIRQMSQGPMVLFLYLKLVRLEMASGLSPPG